MEKRISFFEFQSVRSIAKACNPLILKRKRVEKEIAKLVEEHKDIEAQINTIQAGIESVLGITVDELVCKQGSDYVPTSKVTYDAATKQYIYREEDTPEAPEEPIVPPTTADGPGTDFDEDRENNDLPFAESAQTEETVF